MASSVAAKLLGEFYVGQKVWFSTGRRQAMPPRACVITEIENTPFSDGVVMDNFDDFIPFLFDELRPRDD